MVIHIRWILFWLVECFNLTMLLFWLWTAHYVRTGDRSRNDWDEVAAIWRWAFWISLVILIYPYLRLMGVRFTW